MNIQANEITQSALSVLQRNRAKVSYEEEIVIVALPDGSIQIGDEEFALPDGNVVFVKQDDIGAFWKNDVISLKRKRAVERPEVKFQHLRDYIDGLTRIIQAGVDVQTVINGKSLPVIRQISILEDEKCLQIWVLLRGRDRMEKVSANQKFTVEFNDYPNDMREAGWE